MRQLVIVLLLGAALSAQTSPAVTRFVKYPETTISLEHVRVIDGTGAAAAPDQTVLIAGGKIVSVTSATSAQIPREAKRLDLTGHTVFPGIVGMHEHLFSPAASAAGPSADVSSPANTTLFSQSLNSFPRLYLAAGVTTIRTVGAIQPYADLELSRAIDAGRIVGPTIFVGSPFLEGTGGNWVQMHRLSGPDDARAFVNYWADQGVAVFKAYTHITRAELKAAIEEAHKRGLRVTAHLCSVTVREAVDAGIDNLEHGIISTDFIEDKKPDQCPPMSQRTSKGDMRAKMQELIQYVVDHHVAVTSILPVIESFAPNRPRVGDRVLASMSPQLRVSYLAFREHVNSANQGFTSVEALKGAMANEYAFAKAGGTLLAGSDPTGPGLLAGYANQREIELLVEAGFTPLEAIKIATYNGAAYLGKLDSIGTVSQGKTADLVVVKGDPSKSIADIENVELVIKNGVAYDPAALENSVRGMVGIE